jgi:hypothetical protein
MTTVEHVSGTLISTAVVRTDRPARYGKQLISHLGRRLETAWDERAGVGRLTFAAGTGDLVAASDGLHLRIEGPSERIAELEDVIGRHLVRFGSRDELVVQWRRSDGTAGTTQRYAGDDPSG